jgi:hypothetical protein
MARAATHCLVEDVAKRVSIKALRLRAADGKAMASASRRTPRNIPLQDIKPATRGARLDRLAGTAYVFWFSLGRTQ